MAGKNYGNLKRCTGMNFDRPEFERLLKALQERKIDCIVVKDFSRLGRNFVETGQYLEQVFPLFGVRFIAINDNYDSLNSQSRDGMLVPIKSMINEMSQREETSEKLKEAGDYMERIFPLLGVRFISVNDGYDSGMQMRNDVCGLEVAIKYIINAS